MADLVLSAGRIVLALFLVFLNGFFVAAEFAFVRLRSASVETMVQEGRRMAPTVKEATDNLDDYLAVSQLGITISSLGLGWVGEPAVAVVVEPILAPLLPAALLHPVTVGIGFGIVTFLHVVYGELAPKTLAIQRAERIALLVALPMKLFYYLFLPGIVVFNGVAIRSVGLLGVTGTSGEHGGHSEAEILTILSEAGEAGRVDAEEVEMIERVFSLDDTTVREVMRPRPDVTSIPAGTSLAELRARAVEGEYTRYPVDELLAQFQEEQRQMAAVIDEWGTFEGLVTIEDVVEVIVGDIRDQFDLADPAPSIDAHEDGGYAIDGDVPLTTVNDRLETAFESGDVDTVGGFVLSRLGRAPEVGDTVDAGTHRFRVDDVDGARITGLVVTERES